MASPYYRPSGRLGFTFFLRAPYTGILCLTCAWAYAWCGAHGNVFLIVAAFVVFFVILLVVLKSLAEGGNARNPAIVTLVAIGITVLAWYGNWVFWANMTLGRELSPGSWEPATILAAIHAPGEQRDVVGRYLALVFEFLAFVVLPVIRARETAQSPFCEAEKKWPEKISLERRFEAIPVDDRPRFIAAIEADPDGFISQLQDFPSDPQKYTKLELHALKDGGEGFLTIKAYNEAAKDSTTEKTETTLAEYLRLSPAVTALIKTEFLHDVNHAQAAPAAYTPPASEDDEEPAPVPTADEIAPAVNAMHAGQFDEAISLAQPYLDAGLAQLRSDAIRVSALCASRLDQWSRAADFWQALFAHEETAHNALQVSTSMVMAGYLSEGEDWFAKSAKLNDTTQDITPVLMHTNFITALKQSGYLRAAMPYMEWVKSLYEKLQRTDPTFLTMRGVPLFESFIEQSAPVVDASMDRAQAHAWYASMLPHLDQPGRQTLESYLKDKRTI